MAIATSAVSPLRRRMIRVSVKFVNDMVILKRETGGLAPRAQGNGGGHGKLEAMKASIGKRMTEKPDMTLDDLVTELAERHGITIHRVLVWRLLRGLGLSHKVRRIRKGPSGAFPRRTTCKPSSRSGQRFAAARHIWITRRQPFMRNLLPRLGFIDETALKTNMAKTTGWSPKGARLIDHAPFGHWNTQTFIAALRHDRLDAPWVIGGAMNRELFDLYVETQLAPTLQKGDVVILDNLTTHKSPKAATLLKDIGAWFVLGESRPLDAFLIPQTPAAILPRSQPNRDGIRQAQDPDQKSGSQNL